ncbi:MAG TPA: pilus assembly PilX N-terminal domain-containing protein [Candidatus Paceibacterota bacterium]|nr:pilus assembly PilX N-terminal domain-containing protein [Candidatus Paceibacterota bacterium]
MQNQTVKTAHLRQQRTDKGVRRVSAGFMLVYTVLILSIMLIVGGIFVNTVVKEVGMSRDESESLKAFYAADSGVECVRYFKNKYDAFNTQVPQSTYDCGIGSSFTAGGNPPTSQCTEKEYTFQVGGFTSGACMNITVDMTPRTITVNGNPVIVCDTNVIADGMNTCNLSSATVERSRWETL